MPDIKMRLLLLLSLFVITTCYGQEKDYKNIQFKQYNSIQGLQTAACDNIYQDKYGFLWISTYYGISIFDGTHFFNLPMYTQDSAFNLSQKPHTFLQKDSFNMVISSPNGLYTYNYRTHTITKNKQQPIPIGRETIKLLGKSKTGNNIHLKTFSTFYTIDSADKIIDKKELNGPGYEKDAIHIGSYTSHYFLTKNNQLIEHNLSDNSSKPLLKLPYKPKFAILNTENRQQAIICTDKYLYHLPANAESPLVKLDLSPYETNPSTLPINDISCDQQGNYWIGGMNKLLVYFPKEQKLLNLRPQLAEAGGRSDTHIVDIINNKDEVYLSTTMSGILISNRSDLVTNINNFPKGGDIVGTIALKKNTLLCGNSSNVINRISYSNDSYQVSYNPVKNIHTTFIAHLENLDENHTWAIYWDKFKLDIINTQKMEALNLNFPIDEVSRQHKESFKISLPTKDAIPIIKKINDSLFLFTANNKLYEVTGAVSRGFQFSLIDSIKGNHYFTSIDLPDPGHVYLGTSGLQVFQLVNGKLEKIIDEFNSNIPVRYVLEDGNKHKYLLTTNGIYVYKATNQFSHRLSAETNQINGNIIYSGYIDQSNIL
ncbi:hypothetical protein [Flavihumibacter sp. CACIAM 22H1]|uniref:hypothetical protein n=1 Tax=Flavihumibacter sp. CACIAM 22H1 TaxID=1812911 RepID=UPI0007A906C4|nr:hypothetical protein [Flavihumibacter sp. CACIAM 22H1]KYP15200.1 MAG: hypothetical protein A1D16_03015 [Flavihumibacter sp. CACIAM 22H1]